MLLWERSYHKLGVSPDTQHCLRRNISVRTQIICALLHATPLRLSEFVATLAVSKVWIKPIAVRPGRIVSTAGGPLSVARAGLPFRIRVDVCENRLPAPVRKWYSHAVDGEWRSPVARSVRDAEVGGSNPLSPTVKEWLMPLLCV